LGIAIANLRPVPSVCGDCQTSNRNNNLFDMMANCYYGLSMVTFDENKRLINMGKHGIDLADVESVFDWPMVTEEDDRDDYGEQRLASLGWFNACVVVLIWVECEQGAHIISCR
jgi:uncharacterized DUF497 family protein